ncbi:hypothetical protein J4226_01530 [Candidatus Pacearchaeota archaeon]|nr:hypothetical protein [Candidatus Pacearchaeota archaeon]
MKNNNQLIWIIITICAVLFISFFGFTGTSRYEMMDGFYGNMMGNFGMGLFGWLFMSLAIIALMLFIVWLIKQIQESKK